MKLANLKTLSGGDLAIILVGGYFGAIFGPSILSSIHNDFNGRIKMKGSMALGGALGASVGYLIVSYKNSKKEIKK